MTHVVRLGANRILGTSNGAYDTKGSEQTRKPCYWIVGDEQINEISSPSKEHVQGSEQQQMAHTYRTESATMVRSVRNRCRLCLLDRYWCSSGIFAASDCTSRITDKNEDSTEGVIALFIGHSRGTCETNKSSMEVTIY